MAGSSLILLILLAVLVAVPLAVVLIVFVVLPLFKALGWLIRQIFRFVFGEIGDLLRAVGAVLTGIVLVPLVVLTIIVGRWSASAHYGRAIQGEIKTLGLCIYRMVIGHPARLLCLTALTDGIEHRLPEVVAHAPGRDRPARRVGQFEGYQIVGSLPGGGSGGKLYIAEPDDLKRAAFSRAGQHDVGRVVIKVFSLRDGSSLPQIVRESRALDAAKKLGLVLEHELNDERFFYVMRFVPGESLGLVTQRLHAATGGDGLGKRELGQALSYAMDLVRTLQHYHRGGLWHKDVKPDNIIIHDGSAHLVDFGLVTPLRSSMTLTTHGTEYFRDPELVRLALKGVKVHEVDGARFDVYAAGAVLYSIVENSFPAHGGLSQVSKRCPEALRWIIRRAMTDYDKRYASAAQMLADLESVAQAEDPFAVQPAALPSVRGGLVPEEPAVEVEEFEFSPVSVPKPGIAGGPTDVRRAGSPVPPRPRRAPKITVTGWWSGRYRVEGAGPAAAAPAGEGGRFVFSAGMDGGKPFVSVDRGPVRSRPNPAGRSAQEQLASARARAHAARARAEQRMKEIRRRHHAPSSGGGVGVAVAVLVFMAVAVLLAGAFLLSPGGRRVVRIEGLGEFPDLPVVRVGRAGSASATVIAPEAPPPAPLVAPTPPAPRISADGVKVVVLRDPISHEPNHAAAAERTLQALAAHGFALAGYGDVDEVTRAENTELLAGLRADIALSPFRSEGARESLNRWLTEHDDVGMVLWLSRSPDRPEAMETWLVIPSRTSEEVTELATQLVAPGG